MNAVSPQENQTIKSGLLAMRDAVDVYFKENAVPAEVTPVGLKYRSFTLNQSFPSNANRVVFIPGEFDGTELKPRKYGTLSRNNRNSASVQNPRELLTWDRPFTVSIWGAPVRGKTDHEGLSIGIVEDLLEQVVRAVQYSQMATVIWGDVIIQTPPMENSFGAELLVGATQRGPIYDVSYDIAYANPVTPHKSVK